MAPLSYIAHRDLFNHQPEVQASSPEPTTLVLLACCYVCVFLGCLVHCSWFHPPHRTGQTHLQPLSSQEDIYKAAGMKADGASGPDRRTELGSLTVASQSYVVLLVLAWLPQWRDSVDGCFCLNIGLIYGQ